LVEKKYDRTLQIGTEETTSFRLHMPLVEAQYDDSSWKALYEVEMPLMHPSKLALEECFHGVLSNLRLLPCTSESDRKQ